MKELICHISIFIYPEALCVPFQTLNTAMIEILNLVIQQSSNDGEYDTNKFCIVQIACQTQKQKPHMAEK